VKKGETQVLCPSLFPE